MRECGLSFADDAEGLRFWARVTAQGESFGEEDAHALDGGDGSPGLFVQSNRECAKRRQSEEGLSENEAVRQAERGASGDAEATEEGGPETVEAWTGGRDAIWGAGLIELLGGAFAERTLRAEDSERERLA